MVLTPLDLFLLALAAVAGGAVNAIAGGGTLITFPVLTAFGIPALSANVTNAVALTPGYLSGTWAQRADMRGQEGRLRYLAPVSFIGGLLGALILLATGEAIFRTLVPFLILIACALLWFQSHIRAWIVKRMAQSNQTMAEGWVALPVFLASVYGGYFTAGQSIMLLAVLGLVLHDTLNRLNALKQALAFCVTIVAAVYFALFGPVIWSATLVMAVGSILGGALGGRLASRIPAELLRRVVVVFGVLVALNYLRRL
jgi:uncharacterized protein